MPSATTVPTLEIAAAKQGIGYRRSARRCSLIRLALVDNMLLYFDKTSMAASLEVRVPFMDHDVVSFCMALPDSRRISARAARSCSSERAGTRG